MLEAITGIADGKAEAPTSKPADFSRVRRVNSAKPVFDAFIWDCRLAVAKTEQSMCHRSPTEAPLTLPGCKRPSYRLAVRRQFRVRRDGGARRRLGRRRQDEVAGGLSGSASAGACTLGGT